MKPYVLGVDSGGTKYLVRAAALDGTILGEYKGGTCSHYHLGEESAAQQILQCLEGCLQTFGGIPQDCACIVVGTTGYDSPEDGEILTRIYTSLPGFDCPAYCMNDVELAHYTVTGGVGVLTLAGTGSIVFGRGADGAECRVGGWMKSIFGDEGSGRWLDSRALHHYSRWMDGCRPDSALIRTIEARIGAGRKALMDYSQMMAEPPWPNPNLSYELEQAAEQGDEYAQKILREAAACLFDMTDEAIRLLDLGPCFPAGIWGGVLLNCSHVQAEFRRLLQEKYPRATLVTPTTDAAQGAVEIALRWQAAGGDCRDILRGGAKRAV